MELNTLESRTHPTIHNQVQTKDDSPKSEDLSCCAKIWRIVHFATECFTSDLERLMSTSARAIQHDERMAFSALVYQADAEIVHETDIGEKALEKLRSDMKALRTQFQSEMAALEELFQANLATPPHQLQTDSEARIARFLADADTLLTQFQLENERHADSIEHERRLIVYAFEHRRRMISLAISQRAITMMTIRLTTINSSHSTHEDEGIS